MECQTASLLLTIDFGTSITKAVLWDDGGPVAVGRTDIATFHPEPGRAEQDPDDWWSSTIAACEQVREQDASRFRAVTAIGFSTARETFVPVAADGRPLGPALLWSDRRAGEEAAALNAIAGGVEALRDRTGMVVDAGSAVAKVAWMSKHKPSRLRDARWLLGPRDLVFWRLTGEVATDTTLASRTGFYGRDGSLATELGAGVETRLPPIWSPSTHASLITDALGIPRGTPVVLGAGDRQCEVLGTGATDSTPMVSWGTTANVSVPAATLPQPLPPGLAASRGAVDGYLIEAGLSASGAALTWLQHLTGLDLLALVDAAAATEPGARGVVALPWLNGARAPWWHPGARAAFLNLTPSHGAGDLARAIYEAVAYDVVRCLEAMASAAESGDRASAAESGDRASAAESGDRASAAESGDRASAVAALAATGGGVAGSLWVELLAAVAGVPVVLRRSGEAASAGACLLTGRATETMVELDRINPVVATTAPDASLAKRYRDLRPLVDRVALGVLGLDLSEWSTGWT
jgi:xylulokinase